MTPMWEEQISTWISTKKLIFFKVVKPKIGLVEFYGRILNYENGKLLIYLDDEKRIYTAFLSEIEDIKPSKV